MNPMDFPELKNRSSLLQFSLFPFPQTYLPLTEAEEEAEESGKTLLEVRTSHHKISFVEREGGREGGRERKSNLSNPR